MTLKVAEGYIIFGPITEFDLEETEKLCWLGNSEQESILQSRKSEQCGASHEFTCESIPHP